MRPFLILFDPAAACNCFFMMGDDSVRHIFIVNPHSGPQNATSAVQKGIQEIAGGKDCEIYVTRCPGDATEYVRQTCSGTSAPLRFYACGGDGTLNEVVNGAAGFAHAAVGWYPCGSGNDFVKYFGGKGAFQNVRALTEGTTQRIDLLRVNGRYAINVVNFGFDAKVASRMIRFRRLPLMRGHRAYYCAIAMTVFDGVRHRCRLSADGEVLIDGSLLLCTLANGDYVGGSFRCAPRADVCDGQMEVCAVRPISRLRFAKLMGIYRRGEHLEAPQLRDCICYRRAQKVEIDADPGFLMCLDGEIIQDRRFTVESLPGALSFIVPDGARHSGKKLDMQAEKAI